MPKDLDSLPARPSEHAGESARPAEVAGEASRPAEVPGEAGRPAAVPNRAPGDPVAKEAPARPEAEAPAEPEAKKARGPGRKILLAGVGLVALIAAGWYGYGYWTNGRFLVETDDAYVQVDFAALAPKVTGYVAAVPAVANAHVKAGDPLVIFDDGDYRNALELAQSQLDAQVAAVSRIGLQEKAGEAGIAQAEAKVAAAEAVRIQTEADFARYTQLASTDAATTQRLEAARAASATAEANLQEAQAGVATARADLDVLGAQRDEARAVIAGLTAQRDKAQRDLDDTVLRAPVDGVIGNLSVAAGDYVTPGKRLLAVVPLDQVHIDANFKETQIERLAPGAKVTISVDAFPDREVTGTVQGVSPASGSVFSLLPPENATGNFTKIVQRVPVRIAVPADVAAQGWLRPGLSVTVTADPRTTPAS